MGSLQSTSHRLTLFVRKVLSRRQWTGAQCRRMLNVRHATLLDIVRFIFSLGLLLFSAVVTCYSILEQKTGMWKEVPGWAGLLIFIFVLWCLWVMEGLQIALVELKRLNPDYYKTSHPTTIHGRTEEGFLFYV